MKKGPENRGHFDPGHFDLGHFDSGHFERIPKKTDPEMFLYNYYFQHEHSKTGIKDITGCGLCQC